MDIVLVSELVALVLLLGLSAFFSSSETSLFSLSSAQMQQMRRDRNPRLRLIEHLLSEPRRLIATILIGNEFVNVSASVLSATIVIAWFGAEKSWLNIVIMVPVLLLFGEITPKTLALSNNVEFASFQCRYIELFARAISPLRKVVRTVSEFFINLIVSEDRSADNILTEDMVRSLTKAAVGEGSLDRSESQYIHQIFDFGNKTVSDVMTYGSQIVSVDTTMALAEILEVQRRKRHSKIPVFDAEGEVVIGVLFARDVLALPPAADAEEGLAALMKTLRKPYLVPGSRKAADLFVRMRSRRTSVALVTDEYGGIVGLVTMEDLLECIFGELPSGSDAAVADSPVLEKQGTNRFRASGTMSIRQFNETAGTSLAHQGLNTLGGLVLHACGEVPDEGTKVQIDNVVFTVSRVSHQRIVELDARVKHVAQPKGVAAARNTSTSNSQTTDAEPGEDPKAGPEPPARSNSENLSADGTEGEK